MRMNSTRVAERRRRMMHLKKGEWGEGLDPSTPVGALASSLTRQRLYREVTLALRTGLRDAKAEFSFLRLRGLRQILKFLQSVAESETTICLFQETQSIPQLQVVPVLFENTLIQSKSDPIVNLDQIYSLEPIKITSPATDSEISLALRVLEGCCLLHKESTTLAHRHRAIKVLMNILSSRGVLEQGACLGALISIMLDSSANQMEFEAYRGIDKITSLIKDEKWDENIRLRCGEFLLLLIGHVNEREEPPLAYIQEDIRRLLGEKCASLIWAASRFGSTLDPDQRQTALHIHAGRILESLELY